MSTRRPAHPSAPRRLALLMLASVSAAALSLASPPARAQTAPAQTTTTLTPRQQVQHLLRRFTLGEPPETVTAVVNGGIAPWLATQLQPQTIDDSTSTLEPLPTTAATNSWGIWERNLVQHMMHTNRQVQAKLELHWLDHFSVGLQTVGDPALMWHYDQVIRANALGNFGTLLAAVAQEPAMLLWLSNNNNVPPTPNENFARELMQLYSTGEFKLNPDGTPVLNAAGVSVTNYSQADIKAAARAMTGYSYAYTGGNPQTSAITNFNPAHHVSGSMTFLKKTITVPADASAMSYICNILAHSKQTAIYESKQLLQRFVSENPSPAYVSAIAAVWTKYVDAPDQIARVVSAIINHPEFNSSYMGMAKQPAEQIFGALRILPGALISAGSSPQPGYSVVYDLLSMGQELFYPPSVFSFYTPGNISTLTNSSTMLNRSTAFSQITSELPGPAWVDTYLDIPALRTRINATDGPSIANYLLDALLDGASPALKTKIVNFLGAKPDDAQLRGALWLILNSPDFGVN